MFVILFDFLWEERCKLICWLDVVIVDEKLGIIDLME